MAIISSVTFLLRLCLCTTDPQAGVELQGGKPQGSGHTLHSGHALLGFNCRGSVEHRATPAVCSGGDGLCTGERVGGTGSPLPRVGPHPRHLSLPRLPSHTQVAPEQAMKRPRRHGAGGGLRRWEVGRWHCPSQAERMGAAPWPSTQPAQAARMRNGRRSFQNRGNGCDVFSPQALELCN